MALKKIYFAKLKYNYDFYTYTSFIVTYYHIYCNINYIKILFHCFLVHNVHGLSARSEDVKTSWGSNSRAGNV
jgi:hypothetical protein